jgi:HD-GYP domain-containing protein (c-di-GMP phosphodiesterase class II)
MKYVPIPVSMLEVGKPLPVDVWSPAGQLLLRKGQPVLSESHRDKLAAHQASSTAADGLAWQKAYERMVHNMLRDGVDLQEIARAPMPSEIRETDYVATTTIQGGWIDLQEMLRGILYQGGLTINPLKRLALIEQKALALLEEDPDDSLFSLFQALADDTLGYCATHALLCAALCELTAQKLDMAAPERRSLFNAALTMNMGMAREQDRLARQSAEPSPAQRELIHAHPQKCVELLAQIGVDDPDQIDIVRWHHAPESPEGDPRNLGSRRLLGLADAFVARTAGRRTRSSQAAVKAVRSMVLGAQGDTIGVGSAMAQAVGFYPPGTYVLLASGETAVAVQRGERANTPWVICIADKDGVAVSPYVCRDTANFAYTIESPVNFESIRIAVYGDKVRKARQKIKPKAPAL